MTKGGNLGSQIGRAPPRKQRPSQFAGHLFFVFVKPSSSGLRVDVRRAGVFISATLQVPIFVLNSEVGPNPAQTPSGEAVFSV